MKIISWNINSLRLRLPLLQKITEQENPDIICLQETKVQDAEFPLEGVKALGFKFVEFSGEKSYNGVAILSKIPLEVVKIYNILDFGHKRHVAVEFFAPQNKKSPTKKITLHNFYVPAGGDIPDPKLNDKFDFKLKFIDWMSEYFVKNYSKNDSVIILGDMNIAPLEHDVWSHKQLLKIVSHTPIEVEKMEKLRASLNWIDSHRLFVSENEKLYSWWSYRAKDPIGADKGRRLDHIWTTPALKNNIIKAEIFKKYRSETQPSDHVPISIELDFSNGN